MVGVRERLVDESEVVWTGERSKEFVGMLGRFRLKIPVCGLQTVVLGSLHIHNDCANKRPAATRNLIAEFLSACDVHGCDIFGVDANQGMKKLEEGLMPGSMLAKTPPEDCCALVLPPRSQLLRPEIDSASFTFYSFFLPDIGWSIQDASSHYQLIGNFREAAAPKRGRRDPQTLMAAKHRQQQAKNARKRERQSD